MMRRAMRPSRSPLNSDSCVGSARGAGAAPAAAEKSRNAAALEAKKPREVIHVLHGFDAPNQVQDLFDLRLPETTPGGAFAEFIRKLAVAHGIRGRALAEVGLGLQHRP